MSNFELLEDGRGKGTFPVAESSESFQTSVENGGVLKAQNQKLAS